jgi:hypothetical protein
MIFVETLHPEAVIFYKELSGQKLQTSFSTLTFWKIWKSREIQKMRLIQDGRRFTTV